MADLNSVQHAQALIAKKKELLKPAHHYGLIQGVHVFYALHDGHTALKGLHVHDADDATLDQALKDAKAQKHPSVILHGQLPSSLLAKTAESLNKAFLQHDGETKTDPTAHSTALAAIPPELMDWGVKNLVPLKPDEPTTLEFHGKIIKIRKLMDDVYSGWLEGDGKITHQFERVTLPELLVQLQSKLELYGPKEKDVAEPKKEEIKMPLDEVIDEHEKLVDALEHPTAEKLKDEAKEQSTELNEYKDTQAVAEKLKDLKGKLEDHREHQETVNGTELVTGIENPEKDCPACENASKDCSCYTGLPNPRVEFDGKKVTIFFKSEWNEEDRSNFLTDLKRRAGLILDKRRITRAQSVLSEIRSKLGAK